MNNTKQMALAWLMYAEDNDDRPAPNIDTHTVGQDVNTSS